MQSLLATPATPENLTSYGQVITPAPNGADFGPGDAVLQLNGGQPRFWVMQLDHRPPRVAVMARHSRCSQCLASADGRPWWIVLAPPQPASDKPETNRLRLFRIEAGLILKLHVGTWHAGPYFREPQALFFNLELADTNSNDFTEAALPEPLSFAMEPNS